MSRLILVVTLCAVLAACDKRTAKFRVGDKVVVKYDATTKGVIVSRNSPFVDDLYYLRVAGPPDDNSKTWIMTAEGKVSKEWHLQGPYGEEQLQLQPE